MWDDLVIKESRGNLTSDDLIWSPDSSVSLPAYVDRATPSSLVKSETGTSYLSPSISAQITHSLFLVDGSVVLPESLSEGCLAYLSAFNPELVECVNEYPSAIFDPNASSVLEGKENGLPGFNSANGVDVYVYDHVGAGPSTQIALALYSLDRFFRASQIPEALVISVRTDLLTEISKLRALRIILKHLAHIHDQVWNGRIHAFTSALVLSPYDERDNLIRCTISATAAIFGGADSLSVQPWNVLSTGYSDQEAARLSNNIYLMLKHESHLEMVMDPLAGSFSIEHGTNALLDASWNLFIRIKDMTALEVHDLLRLEILPADRCAFRNGALYDREMDTETTLGVTPAPELDERVVFPISKKNGFSSALSKWRSVQ